MTDVTLKVILDIIILLVVGVPILVFKFGVTPFHRGFYANDETISYPFKASTISTAVLSVVGLGLPLATMLITELILYRVKSQKGLLWTPNSPSPYIIFKKPLHQFVVMLYTAAGPFLFGAALCQTGTDIMKYSIGRLRPHFLDVCRPNWGTFNITDENGFPLYIEGDVCTGDHELIQEARLSHPSGHSSLSAYTMIYFSFYIQARFYWKGSKLIKHFIQTVALYMALYTCLSRISDYKHHWSDVLGGALLGTAISFITVFFISPLFKLPKLGKLVTQVAEMQQFINGTERHNGTDPGNVSIHSSPGSQTNFVLTDTKETGNTN